MNLIVAVDNNWAIGRRGKLLVSIPNDMKHFREETAGKVVVFGRKTLDTFPQSQPLANRTNIILSTNKGFTVKGAIIVSSLEALLEELKKYDDEDIYVIGGDSVYKQLLPYCKVAHVTKIDHEYEADTYFPNLDQDPAWQITAESDEQTYFDLPYTFLKYERI
ncbi:MAG: dihydrofolate reductase [Lachnospiraceae bacterium]|nr:dihydrofolate reductase [Lachnospiraceae bacterium]